LQRQQRRRREDGGGSAGTVGSRADARLLQRFSRRHLRAVTAPVVDGQGDLLQPLAVVGLQRDVDEGGAAVAAVDSRSGSPAAPFPTRSRTSSRVVAGNGGGEVTGLPSDVLA